MTETRQSLRIRPAEPRDLDQLVEIDAAVSGARKPDYWRDMLDRFRRSRDDGQCMLVAEFSDGEAGMHRVAGFVMGEVRAWEFGSDKCGWVFAIAVDPTVREGGIGEALLDSISDKFRAAGVHTMRTMVSRDNHLLMSFFRSEGMKAGPYLQLEMDLG